VTKFASKIGGFTFHYIYRVGSLKL